MMARLEYIILEKKAKILDMSQKKEIKTEKNLSVSQEIKNIIEVEQIDYELRFLKPFKSINYTTIKTAIITDNTTKVTWSFSGKMNYPFNVISLIANMEGSLKKDFEIGLANLKIILER